MRRDQLEHAIRTACQVMSGRKIRRGERRDAKRELRRGQKHEQTDRASGFGGYYCTCGSLWLTNGCMTQPPYTEGDANYGGDDDDD